MYIDKTKVLEEGIGRFPSIYIEGAAASGKTVAVQMLKKKYPEVMWYELNMDEELEDLQERLDAVCKRMEEERIWVVFENLGANIAEADLITIRRFARKMPEGNKAILVSRECPHPVLLDLYWKRELDIISQEKLCFTPREIGELLEQRKSNLSVEEVYEQTGGWAGCVDVMLRISQEKTSSVEEIRASYEMDAYINEVILECLSELELSLLGYAGRCPWINEKMCKEIWDINNVEEILIGLERKGLLRCLKNDKQWYVSRILKGSKRLQLESRMGSMLWEKIAIWYEAQGYIKETLWCLRKMDDMQAYRACLVRNYTKLPFSTRTEAEVMNITSVSPRTAYLKAMYCYEHQDLDGFRRELEQLTQLETSDEQQEIYLNLMYVNPEISLGEWMGLFDGKTKIRLYHMLGNSCTYLCGLRDLTSLFSCSKKVENQCARFWKEHLGEMEWKAYCLARLDYYIETKREDSIKEEDWLLLHKIAENKTENYQLRLVALYLLCKWCSVKDDDEIRTKINHLERTFSKEEHEVCARNAFAISSVYASWREGTEQLVRWIRQGGVAEQEQIGEWNYIEILCKAKGYLLLNHFERAEKLFKKVIVYLNAYKKNRFYMECLFQLALISWDKDRRGQAIKYCIESFAVNGEGRYVGPYTRHGKRGYEVLNAYMEWVKSTSTEGWHRKKKYNYGNVLRMPMEDYLDYMVRSAKRENRAYAGMKADAMEEHLTMTEVIILQSLSRGLSNTEICEEQNLKLPTVKSHIYSIYRKLDVNNRVQAILKGKELGVVK